MIRLSYSSLSNLHNGHEWLNKQMGIPVPNYHFLKEGKDGHRIIQDHVAGIKKHKYLKKIEIKFPIVEERDFDERCKFEFSFNRVLIDYGIHETLKEVYNIIGFYDGRVENYSKTMEGKFSSAPWSMGKFKKDIQRKIYALSNEGIKEQFLITGQRDVERWKNEPPKIYGPFRPTKQDKKDAIEWILKGIRILEKGDFTGGLDKNGKCTDCFWNIPRYRGMANCNFL